MNRSTVPFVAPEYELVTEKGILERFAKYTVSGVSSISFPFECFPGIVFFRSEMYPL